ncbi:hypothetical protein M0R72_18940 [Candidatus Pacearchaeota archaeon]|jgi:phosphotransferase system IIA component|nr:hypothetical protein [Candidatus Pacearchaeota archaeon]
MEEEFLKKFVGKQVAILPFGGSLNAGIRGKVASMDGAILRLVDDDESIYIDIDGIMAVMSCCEAIQDED